MVPIIDEFDAPLDARWTRTVPGGGSLSIAHSALRLALPAGAVAGRYSDAQIDDYSSLPLRRFPWRPPLRLEVRARASHPIAPLSMAPTLGERGGERQLSLRGTAGFGFWNYPLSLTGAPRRLPDAVWFFAASPPSNMALVPGSPGWGWKAQVVHAHRWRALAAGAPALAAILGARVSGREALAERWVGRVTGAHEAHLAVNLAEWHDYTLDWRRDRAHFFVDGREALMVRDPPRGPLGFVAWLDNQYAVATPRGQLRFGTLASAPEWLELEWLRILPGATRGP
ncbi:MAG: hypothetical protein IVW57_04145 [Ktedonobacterales bacterium]|nr:hypothetical protein [Ktedonobacterales bacterium]